MHYPRETCRAGRAWVWCASHRTGACRPSFRRQLAGTSQIVIFRTRMHQTTEGVNHGGDRSDYLGRHSGRAGIHAARDDAHDRKNLALVGLQHRTGLFQRAVQRQRGDGPAGPRHPDSSGLAHAGAAQRGRLFCRRHSSGRRVLPQRPGLERFPHRRLLHVQAGLLPRRTRVLDGQQGPRDGHRRTGARGLQPGRERDLRRGAAHSAAQDMGPRHRTARRREFHPDERALAPPPGRGHARPTGRGHHR